MATRNKSVSINNNRWTPNAAVPASPKSKQAAVKAKPKGSVFKKSICGDIFGSSGSSMLGMMYRSRAKTAGDAYKGGSSYNLSDDADDNDVTDAVATITDNGEESGSEDEIVEKLNPRQQLALTIKNWSVLPKNDLNIMHEGGVHALIALAGFDDPGIKKGVATALFNLSSRSENRAELLSIGGATGVITIAMNAKTCKLARLCANTLCNLSMASGGEASMAKAGAVIALVVLLGMNQHRLLPVCVQALYNLSCVHKHFTGMERISKALLTLPAVQGYDVFVAQSKAMVNCSRYSWMRDRLIEDGVLQVFAALVNSLPVRDDPTEISFYVVTTLRSLSETKSCLTDLISKGTVELLQQMLPYCDADTCVLVIKTLRNLLKIVHSIPASIYAAAVNIATDLAQTSNDEIVLQYVASCIHLFTQDDLRNDPRLVLKAIRSLTKLLTSTDSLTQFFSVAATGNLFFNNICNDTRELEVLVLNFVEAGHQLTDLLAVEELTVAFAKLSQEPLYMDILHHHNKLHPILMLLVRLVNEYQSNYIIQESCCVAICQFVLKMNPAELTEVKEELSDLLFRLLGYPMYMTSAAAAIASQMNDAKKKSPTKRGGSPPQNSKHIPSIKLDSRKPTGSTASMSQSQRAAGYIRVLAASLATIRSVLEQGNGICYTELLEKPNFLQTVASLAVKYQEDSTIPGLCYGVLAVYSFDEAAHAQLSSPAVLKELFAMTKSDNVKVRELISTIFCNVSKSLDSRVCMIKSGVMDILTLLSGATNEFLQELCARCICNLTASTDQHELLITHGVLHTLLMISLVRSVSSTTKQLAARAMLNMLSNEENIDAVLESGIVRAFGTLAGIADNKTQYICAKAFLMFSTIEKGRQELAQRKNVLTAVFGLVKSGKQNKVMVLVGRTVCNLLQSSTTRLASVNAGALSVLKIIATADFPDLREFTARVIISLADDAALHPYLIREPIVSVLVYILENSSDWAMECVIKAFTSLSKYPLFRPTLIEKGCLSAMVGAIIRGKVNTIEVAESICSCVCFLSYESSMVERMITNGHVLVIMYSLYKGKLCNEACANMMMIILRNVSAGNVQPGGGSNNNSARDAVAPMSPSAPASLDAGSVTSSTPSVATSSVTTQPARGSLSMATMQSAPSASAVKVGNHMIEQEAFRLMGWLLSDFHRNNAQIYRSVVIVLHNLCKVHSLHESLIEQGFMDVIYKVALYAEMTCTPTAGLDEASPENYLSKQSLFPTFDDQKHPERQSLDEDDLYNTDHVLTKSDIYHLTTAVRLMSMTASCRVNMVENRCIKVLTSLLFDLTELSRYEIVSALTNLAINKECRQRLIDENAVDLIVSLSHHAETVETQQQCSSALSNLSENATVNAGSMSSLLVLSLRLDTNMSKSSGPIIRKGLPTKSFGGEFRSIRSKSRSSSPTLVGRKVPGTGPDGLVAANGVITGDSLLEYETATAADAAGEGELFADVKRGTLVDQAPPAGQLDLLKMKGASSNSESDFSSANSPSKKRHNSLAITSNPTPADFGASGKTRARSITMINKDKEKEKTSGLVVYKKVKDEGHSYEEDAALLSAIPDFVQQQEMEMLYQQFGSRSSDALQAGEGISDLPDIREGDEGSVENFKSIDPYLYEICTFFVNPEIGGYAKVKSVEAAQCSTNTATRSSSSSPAQGIPSTGNKPPGTLSRAASASGFAPSGGSGNGTPGKLQQQNSAKLNTGGTNAAPGTPNRKSFTASSPMRRQTSEKGGQMQQQSENMRFSQQASGSGYQAPHGKQSDRMKELAEIPINMLSLEKDDTFVDNNRDASVYVTDTNTAIADSAAAAAAAVNSPLSPSTKRSPQRAYSAGGRGSRRTGAKDASGNISLARKKLQMKLTGGSPVRPGSSSDDVSSSSPNLTPGRVDSSKSAAAKDRPGSGNSILNAMQTAAAVAGGSASSPCTPSRPGPQGVSMQREASNSSLQRAGGRGSPSPKLQKQLSSSFAIKPSGKDTSDNESVGSGGSSSRPGSAEVGTSARKSPVKNLGSAEYTGAGGTLTSVDESDDVINVADVGIGLHRSTLIRKPTTSTAGPTRARSIAF